MDDPRRYLDPETLAKVRGLHLQARLAIEGYLAGLHASPYHGFSVEFAQHREYVPGDDIRHVDWKVYGRTERYYLKQYEEETNLVCWLVVDASESMRYASREVTKFDYSAMAAASLAYLILRQQDSVGLALFDDKVRRFVRASGQPSHLNEIVDVLGTGPQREKTRVGAIFHDLAERINRRGMVLVFSDLLDDPAEVLAGLKHLRHRRHEVVVFHVLDPAELDFPFRQTTLFRGMEAMPELLTDPRSLRDGYLAELNSFVDELRRGCRGQDVDFVPLRTDARLDVAPSTFLARRLARRGKS